MTTRRLTGAKIKTGALQDAIFNSANFSSIATDEKGVIQIFNVGAERMLGYVAVDVVNQITPADISDPQELIARAAELSLELDTPITPGFEALVFKASRGIEDIYELTYIRKDGSRFPAIVSVTALRDAQDEIIGYLLIGTDNTVGKQVEAAQQLLDQRLRDQQFYTRSLIESNIDALMMTDPAGIITDVNQEMIELTGRSRAELIGAPCKNFFTDPIKAEDAIKRVLTEHKVSDYELTVRARNGVETVVSYNAATFHDRDDKLQGVFAAARDVTERKRFERALQEKNIELEHASRMKSEFLATMSHELRTPLNAIIGFSEALKDGLMGEMSVSQQDYIGDIFTSGQHLLSLINDILDLSKVEAGMMELELEEVDLKGLLSNSLSIVRDKAAAQRISLDLEIDDDLGTPQLDTRKTKQIVYNLLSNAVKFGEQGGRVTLSARRVSLSSVGSLPGEWAVVRVPAGGHELHRVRRDLRSRHRHRHLHGEHGQAVPGVQPDRQQPGTQVRRHRARPGDGQATRRAARRHGGRGQRGRRRGAFRRLAAAAHAGAGVRPRRDPTATGRPWQQACATKGASRWSSRTTTGRPIWCACCSKPRDSPSCARPPPRPRSTLAPRQRLQPDHAGRPVARHRWLGVPRPDPRDRVARPRAGRDHRRRDRQQPGPGRRRVGHLAEADQPGPAAGLAGRCSASTPSTSARARSWSSTTIRRRSR